MAPLRNSTNALDNAICLSFFWERDDGHGLEGKLEERRRSRHSRKVMRWALPQPSESQGRLPTVAVAAVRTWPGANAVSASCLLPCHLLVPQNVATRFLSKSARESPSWQASAGPLRLVYNSSYLYSLLFKDTESFAGAPSPVPSFHASVLGKGCSVCWTVLPLFMLVPLLLAPQNTIPLLPPAGSSLPSGSSYPSSPWLSLLPVHSPADGPAHPAFAACMSLCPRIKYAVWCFF